MSCNQFGAFIDLDPDQHASNFLDPDPYSSNFLDPDPLHWFHKTICKYDCVGRDVSPS